MPKLDELIIVIMVIISFVGLFIGLWYLILFWIPDFICMQDWINCPSEM